MVTKWNGVIVNLSHSRPVHKNRHVEKKIQVDIQHLIQTENFAKLCQK